jgi:homogentisate 1,2-dioxygenase
LYYVDGDFMSRNNIEQGHITLHPKGIPHGPAPGAMERSIGHTETHELAVMVDISSTYGDRLKKHGIR